MICINMIENYHNLGIIGEFISRSGWWISLIYLKTPTGIDPYFLAYITHSLPVSLGSRTWLVLNRCITWLEISADQCNPQIIDKGGHYIQKIDLAVRPKVWVDRCLFCSNIWCPYLVNFYMVLIISLEIRVWLWNKWCGWRLFIVSTLIHMWFTNLGCVFLPLHFVKCSE